MKQEFVRINSVDGVEQPGILYTPDEPTEKISIHVHGLNGNFYENKFLDTLAKAYTNNNYAFLTFNNRGSGFITELSTVDGSAIIGGSLERFKDCLLDIGGVVDWVKEKGYKSIILQGHSYGCNKVLYYYHHKKDESIKKIVLLAPCDIPSEVKMFLGEEEFKIAKEESTRLVNEGREDELIDFPVMANKKIAAGTFYFDFLSGGENDFIKYSGGVDGKSKILNDVDIPALIIFGSKDVCVLTEPIDIVKGYLENNISNAKIHIIEDADHSYTNKYEELGEIISRDIVN